ncbi:MAG: hypothetical protein CMD21_03040 [Flavobacteriales bacterium]|nr:hypothetical protein [Flavobacteriales bacterium]HAP31077.1 hypothetical protein [Flavobacteriales bacterium]
MRNYYTYILTNKKKTVLYTGMTNNISRRFHRQTTLNEVKSLEAACTI